MGLNLTITLPETCALSYGKCAPAYSNLTNTGFHIPAELKIGANLLVIGMVLILMFIRIKQGRLKKCWN